MTTSGNTVLNTGGAGGIGKALIAGFLARGNRVLSVDRNPEKQQDLLKEFPEVVGLIADLSKKEDIDHIVQFVEQNFPELNVLVNNAGVQYNYLFHEGPPSPGKIERELQINLHAPLLLCSHLLPLLLEKKEAAVINVTSGLALTPKRSAAVYCASKAALRSFSQALRYQLEETPVKVIEVVPPLVDTAMTSGRGKGKITPERLADEFFRKWAKGREEILIGKSKVLKLLLRIAPKRAATLLK